MSLHFRESQFRSQIPKNIEILGISQVKKPASASQSNNLSPFTWNNIKLPAMLIKEKLSKDLNLTRMDARTVLRMDPVNTNYLNKLSKTIDLAQVCGKLQTIKKKRFESINQSIEFQQPKRRPKRNLLRLHDQVIKSNQREIFTRGRYQSVCQQQDSLSRKKMQIKQNPNRENSYKKHTSLIASAELRQNLSTNQACRLRSKVFNGKFKEKEKAQKILNTSNQMKSPRNSKIKNSSSTMYHEMQPYIQNYFLNLNKNPKGKKIIVTANSNYHQKHINEPNQSNFPSHLDAETQFKTLIWTKNQIKNIFRQKSSEQYYNRVQGSHVLTSKQKLHQILNGGQGLSGQFYPRSFSLPQDYREFAEEYDWTLVKMTLKLITKEIKQFQIQMNALIEDEDQDNFSLSMPEIIDDLMQFRKNEDQKRLLNLCLFLQSRRKKEKLNDLFQSVQTYKQTEIELKKSVYIDLIEWCIKMSKQIQQTSANRVPNFELIDYRLLKLIKSYDYFFSTYLPSCMYRNLSEEHNMWIAKPFAASKAAGITIFSSNQQFYTTRDYEYKEYRHKPKYHNKIVMKYLTNPFLIRHSGMDFFVKKAIKQMRQQHEKLQRSSVEFQQRVEEMKIKAQRFMRLEEKFSNRKFDLRQWVLIICDEEEGEENQRSRQVSTRKSIKMYKYQKGYCRFAKKEYQLDSTQLQVHLTNYQIYKKQSSGGKSPNFRDEKQKNSSTKHDKVAIVQNRNNESVLMLDELFEYLQFIEELKERKFATSQRQNKATHDLIRNKYHIQLDHILQKVFKASLPHLSHNSRTFELFGFDLFLDSQMNLYLLEVNLNPGCASERSQKLQQEATKMVEGMFDVVINHTQQKSKQDNSYQKTVQIESQQEYLISNMKTQELQGDQKVENPKSQSSSNIEKIISKSQNSWRLVCSKSFK